MAHEALSLYIFFYFQQTLIKKNCLILDLIKEVETTFTKLCSVKYVALVTYMHYNMKHTHIIIRVQFYPCVFLFFRVKIKTLKNSVNAVLPEWYPVDPLIRNQDEIFAFTGRYNPGHYLLIIYMTTLKL